MDRRQRAGAVRRRAGGRPGAEPPVAACGGHRRTQRHPGDRAGAHADGSGLRAAAAGDAAGLARARAGHAEAGTADQRGRQVRPDRPRSGCAPRWRSRRGQPGVRPLWAPLDRAHPSGSPIPTWRSSSARLRRPRGCPCRETKQKDQRIHGRLLLPRAGSGGRDRQPALPPCGARPRRANCGATREHTASGLTALRFSHYEIAHERRVVIAILRDTVRHLRPVPEPRRRPGRRFRVFLSEST